MREIIFRGKILGSNEWIYGDLRYCGGRYSIYPKGRKAELVQKNTIGEYTGLKDKNGNRIFEGDIICKEYYRSVIKFSRTGFDGECGLTGFVSVEIKNKEWDYIPKGYPYEKAYSTGEKFIECDRCIKLNETEVVGNIYDNTELLEIE